MRGKFGTQIDKKITINFLRICGGKLNQMKSFRNFQSVYAKFTGKIMDYLKFF